MPIDVFISYANQDLAFVTELQQALAERGIAAWFDSDNEKLDLNHQREIKKQIEASQLFLLVQSPASVSANSVDAAKVKLEIREAYENLGKAIVIVIREYPRKSLPPALSAFLNNQAQVDFSGDASPEKFDKLAQLLKTKISASTGDKKTEGVQTNLQGKRRLRQQISRKRQPERQSPVALGGLVVSSVISYLDLEREDEEYVKNELKWLFSAAAHLQQAHQIVSTGSKLDYQQPIPVDIPPNAELTVPEANNCLLNPPLKFIVYGTVEEALQTAWHSKLKIALRNIDISLDVLSKLLDREANLGSDSAADIRLQHNIRNARKEILRSLENLADLMNEAYGIWVASPGQLLELFDEL